jgi:hypothetical protein
MYILIKYIYEYGWYTYIYLKDSSRVLMSDTDIHIKIHIFTYINANKYKWIMDKRRICVHIYTCMHINLYLYVCLLYLKDSSRVLMPDTDIPSICFNLWNRDIYTNICIYMNIYIYIYTYAYVHIHSKLQLWKYENRHKCRYIYIYVYTCIYSYIQIHIKIWIHINIYMYLFLLTLNTLKMRSLSGTPHRGPSASPIQINVCNIIYKPCLNTYIYVYTNIHLHTHKTYFHV